MVRDLIPSEPCTCEECRPGPGIDYAGRDLARILMAQANIRRKRMERKVIAR